MKRLFIVCAAILALEVLTVGNAPAQLVLRPDIRVPELPGFHPLPAADGGFSREIEVIVKESKLDEMTPADKNPDNEDEWSSICVVDLSDVTRPRVGEWKGDNFIYPASTYKMYVLGEAIRQVCAGDRSLDDATTVAARNVRSDSRLTTGQVVSLSEVLRLMCAYSDNTAANVAIDTVDRQRASALMRALGCAGSDITRKFLSRTLEDAEYTTVPGMMTCARHAATFLWAVEAAAIGGGKGRGLIKAYLAMNETNAHRTRAGLPPSATVCSKTGEWNTFTSEAGIVEDGPTRFIICVFTAVPGKVAAPRIAQFTRGVHELLGKTHR
jgi:beta-lactamase class A